MTITVQAIYEHRVLRLTEFSGTEGTGYLHRGAGFKVSQNEPFHYVTDIQSD